VRKTIIALLIISILVSCYVYADNDTSITIEFKLKNGEIRQHIISINPYTEEKQLIEEALRMILADGQVLEITKIDNVPLKDTEYKDYVKNLWAESDGETDGKYDGGTDFDIIERNKDNNIMKEKPKGNIVKSLLRINNEMPIETSIYIDGNNVYLPFRQISEALGAEIGYNPVSADLQIVWAIKNYVKTSLKIGDRRMFIDEREILMELPPIVVENRTYISEEGIEKAYGCSVKYDRNKNEIILKTEGKK